MSDTVTIYIDDKKITCPKHYTVIKAADENGIYIPRFCYHEKLSIVASCRMCLVEVENAPKTLPACATYVTDNMRIFTQSKKTRQSQKAVMEFLLINHPLDCPICDQGGECELQDISMGFGQEISQYTKGKRVVDDEDLGPLIATDMTRCIHCTRCVRFGQEIAGVEELGTIGRGDQMEISTYLKKGLKSELSGNVIDLCPVGALTSKPYRFHGRSWGFKQHALVSPHDGIGSNLYMHTINNGNDDKIMRVVPRKNDRINETWISDRDRFSYQAIQHEERITQPMIKTNDQWKAVDWQTALLYAADSLNQVIKNYDAKQIGVLSHPSSTNEEMYMLQKFSRELGCNNIDYRITQEDFTDELECPQNQFLPCSISNIESYKSFLLIGSNTRKEVPLLNHRIRKAVLKGASCHSMDSETHDFNFNVIDQVVVPYMQWPFKICSILNAVYDIKKINKPELIKKYKSTDQDLELANSLCKDKGIIMVGPVIDSHPQASILRRLLRHMSEISGCDIGYLPNGANASGAMRVGFVPHAVSSQGLNFKQMLDNPRKLYVLHNIEAEYDCNYRNDIYEILKKSFVISINRYRSDALLKYSDIILPNCSFAEMAGSYTNLMGETQVFKGALPAVGDSKPTWKIIVALARIMQMEGFQYKHSEAVLNEINALDPREQNINTLPTKITKLPHKFFWLNNNNALAVDDIVRRAYALQESVNPELEIVRLNSKMAKAFKLKETKGKLKISLGKQSVNSKYIIDNDVADQTMYIPGMIAKNFPKHCQLEIRGISE